MQRTLWVALATMAMAGCATGPVLDGPEFTSPVPAGATRQPNPLYTPLSGPQAYSQIFQNVLNVLHDSGFELLEHNRYDGRIETKPRIAPGVALPLAAGSPALLDRLMATCQTYRHRASVRIQPAVDGGFYVYVVVYKELEDLPRPSRATTGALFPQGQNNVDRRFDVVDPTIFESQWIPRGRDEGMEQLILDQLRSCM